MKHLIVILSTLFFIYSCSGQSTQENTDSSVETTQEAETSGTEASASNEETPETSEGDKTDEEDEDSDTEDDTAGLNQKNVKLVVKNQTTAGQIVVEQVATSRDGWVSIHKSQEEGGIQLPDSIGEARVDSGNSEDIIVDLWEAPDIGEKLWVLLHIDAGERGKYEFPGKDQAVRKDGETMARSFIIEDPNPDEEESDE